MSNKETASANSMEELMALMGVEDEHNEGGNTSGGSGVEDKIEVGTARFRNLPKDYELNSKLSTLAAWTCWHFGEKRKAQNANSESMVLFVTPPWKFLKESDLAQQNVAKRNLYNARKLFQAFDP